MQFIWEGTYEQLLLLLRLSSRCEGLWVTFHLTRTHNMNMNLLFSACVNVETEPKGLIVIQKGFRNTQMHTTHCQIPLVPTKQTL